MKQIEMPRTYIRRLIQNWAVPVGCGLLFLFLLKCVFLIGYVPSASMEPTIHEGSFIFGTRVFGRLKLGAVVVFEHEDHLLVKRIAAMPGDTIVLKGDALIVPDGYHYMLGDNVEISIDSRSWDNPLISEDRFVATLPFL